ncbi:hypothetical protein N7448_010726 [Penicillium atrosanguineum]|uniref:Uncharacterized protein n=1 Tax=Penicillium atrosanguineum TaxID=1132637 RepID=A0A9W9GHY3_9EURO|nr:uncharacterized protein N7443_007948 [Penicillium atrosanguineum]KAJ5119017.1 hypothetical protein N7526_010654 [Penicillium atrosanguineum]KAJ5120057.1 hypothetical protein N7448_010726 [Penicillium atrosanguineum]KAJ5297055.1 hypothetical protein N7443_007948 [Penicillium atrosanguineum]KAJ5299814.1 hypothetical protein N7476_011371 [Penicillium atrosanguineum]
MVTRKSLITAVQSLLTALSTPPDQNPNLLSTFTTNPPPLCFEHGLPQLVPFLGRYFTGQEGVTRYFALLSEHLDIKNMTFEPDTDWLVDEVSMAVCLRGNAQFVWKSTGQAWDETFVYRIVVAEDTGAKGLKVQEYRVWADTGAAYLARLGRLGELVTAEPGIGSLGIHVAEDVDGARMSG